MEVSLGGFLNVKYYPVRVMFPDDLTLPFQLPFGEIREGMLLSEATMSGTLSAHGKPVDGIKICMFEATKPTATICTTTNDLGQYVLTVTPGTYIVELSRQLHRISTTTIDLSSPGYYRNRLMMPTAQ